MAKLQDIAFEDDFLDMINMIHQNFKLLHIQGTVKRISVPAFSLVR